ncbi:MAG: 2OG-Fe(II) oxygenase family protein [Polyangiales bacterium]
MTSNPLQLARGLALPSREASLRRDPSVHRFWETNKQTLVEAWREWEDVNEDGLLVPDTTLLDGRLRDAVVRAWEDPTQEGAVRELFREVSPGVFECQFFDVDRLVEFRAYLEDVWDAEIPVRPPYGIVLNRRGAMLDPRSEGFLGAPAFQVFYRELIDSYMRPIARLLFPEVVGYDTQSFGFSIQYQPDTDTSIRPHTDASAVTLNINVNVPGEEFSGSAVKFFGSQSSEATELVFRPGVAVIHRGNIAHAAQPIQSGSRTNLVLWLYGAHGQLPSWKTNGATCGAQERWKVSTAEQDGFAPF